MKVVGSVAAAILHSILGMPLSVASAQQSEPAPRPNILVAIADDWGWPHAGSYGDPVVQTPTFDRIAQEGVLFEHAFISSPSCTPSRAAILTGQYHWRLQESANLWSTLQAKYAVYPDLLESAGYFVGHTRKGWGPGKVEVGGRSRNPAGPKFKHFAEFLEMRPEQAPFCFWFGAHEPHRGYKAGSGAASGMDLSKISVPGCFPDSEAVRSDIADYYFEVQRFDREVGELLRLLEQRGELERTIVVMTGDHGWPFPRGKSNLYDLGARVPLAVRWPGSVPGGRRVTDFVSLTDLAPTFLEAADLQIPEAMTGRSLLPVLKSQRQGRVDDSRSFVLTGKERHVPCQEQGDSGGTPSRALRTDRFLYIRNFRPDRWPAGTPDHEKAHIKNAWLGDCDNGPTKSYLHEHRDDADVRRFYELAFGKRPAEELYDLGKDPQQLVNVAADPRHAADRERLARRLEELLRASADPRVLGTGEQLEAYPYYGGAPKWPYGR